MPNLRSDGCPRSAPVGRVKAVSRVSGSAQALGPDAAGRRGQHFHQQITLDSQDSRRGGREAAVSKDEEAL